MRFTVRRALFIVALALAFGVAFPAAFAGDTPAAPAAAPAAAAQAQAAPTFESYLEGADVERAKFGVVVKGDKRLLLVPADVLDRDLLWYTEFARVPTIEGLLAMRLSPGGEIGHRAVRFSKKGKALWVQDLTTRLGTRTSEGAEQGDDKDGPGCPTGPRAPLRMSVCQSSLAPILRALPIVAESKTGEVLIDADQLFLTDLGPLDAKTLVPGAVALAPDRSEVESVRAIDRTVEATALMTFTTDAKALGPMASFVGFVDGPATTVEVRHTLTLLPDEPMRPRLFDPRVGYFKTAFRLPPKRPGDPIQAKEVIARFRLEKKDPDAALSDPVEPITFYLSEEIPPAWRPAIKRAVKRWNVAFETAGFKNAIIARDAPTDDPNWNPASLRYSVIRWIDQPVKNAQGAHVSDPRTGEILAAHIMVWNDVIRVFEDLYFLQVGALDERARSLPLPEELRGEILEYVLCHEVGHSLGLRHNHRASQAFTIAQLRDPAFTKAHGSVPSIMSYGRMNYVAQPGDGVTHLLPRIGAYDKWAIHWGYAPLPGAKDPEEEVPTLDAWANEQTSNPWLAFGGEDVAALNDPTVLTENLGDDRIEAARLGLENLKRVLRHLPEALASSPRRAERLRSLLATALGIRSNWLDAAAKELHGTVEHRTLDAEDAEFRLVPAARRRQVLAFLAGQLQTEDGLVTPGIARAFDPSVLGTKLLAAQVGRLDAMMVPAVFDLSATEEFLGVETYPANEVLGDLSAGLFRDLLADSPATDPVRRSLQRHFVKRLADILTPPAPTPPSPIQALLGAGAPKAGPGWKDQRAAALSTLVHLRASLGSAGLRAAPDSTAAVHFQDLLHQVEKALTVR